MGRFSEPLASKFAELVSVRPGQRILDVARPVPSPLARPPSRTG